MVRCLLALAVVVGADILGLRWFSARQALDDASHCHQPWRDEYIANFGHPPEAVRWARPVPQPLVGSFRLPRWRRRPRIPVGTGGARPAPAV